MSDEATTAVETKKGRGRPAAKAGGSPKKASSGSKKGRGRPKGGVSKKRKAPKGKGKGKGRPKKAE